MQKRIRSRHEIRAIARAFSRVQIAIEAREVAAGNFEPDPMPLQKHIAGRPEIDLVLVDLTRRNRFRFSDRGFAEACAQNPLRQILRESIRPHIDELGGKVRIDG